MQTFLVRHALNFPNGGLVIVRHNEIRDYIIHLKIQPFSSNCVHIEPLTHLGCRRSEEGVRHVGKVPEKRGDVSIWGLWDSQTEAIVDVRFG